MEIAWHFTTFDIFCKVLRSGLLKSRSLLVSEALKQRPDYDIIKHDQKAIHAALPKYMLSKGAFLRHRPRIWFSRQQFWEHQAGVFNEVKQGGEWTDRPDGYEQLINLSMKSTYLRGGGLVRFGMREYELLDWKNFLQAEGLPSRLYVPNEYNERFTMVLLTEKLPLSRIARVEQFVPDTFGGGKWVPFMYPSSIGTFSVERVLENYQVFHEQATALLRAQPKPKPDAVMTTWDLGATLGHSD